MDCAIYTRVSTDSQAEVEFNSCQAQEAKVKAFIESQENFRVFKVYEDGGFSGANLERPRLKAMLEDIKDKKVNAVVVYKIDRLTRSPKDFYQLVELFEKHGVDFISVTERFDTSTPSGRLLRNIMLIFLFIFLSASFLINYIFSLIYSEKMSSIYDNITNLRGFPSQSLDLLRLVSCALL